MGRGILILVASSLLCAVLGSVHAFSVFLTPLEAQFGASRSSVSLTYSMALICLTAAVLFGHRLYARYAASTLVLISTGLAMVGVIVAAFAPTLPLVWLGYSLMFGTANGLGYGFGLQIAGQANPGKEGVAMGVVTAAYALGAVLAPGLFALGLSSGGFTTAMLGLGGALLAAGVIASFLMRQARARFSAPQDQTALPAQGRRDLPVIWISYFGGVLAGLMVIGHAAGLLELRGSGGATWLAPVVLAICNLVGSVLGGRAADTWSARLLLSGLSALTVVALCLLLVSEGQALVLVGLGAVGFAYGATIAAYPAAIAKRFRAQGSTEIYGRVFTAWGLAGLAGPWLAGLLFDVSGHYGMALIVAMIAGSVSAVVSATSFTPARSRTGS